MSTDSDEVAQAAEAPVREASPQVRTELRRRRNDVAAQGQQSVETRPSSFTLPDHLAHVQRTAGRVHHHLKNVQRAAGRAQEARQQLSQAVEDAHAGGARVVDIAKVLGVSQAKVYQMLHDR